MVYQGPSSRRHSTPFILHSWACKLAQIWELLRGHASLLLWFEVGSCLLALKFFQLHKSSKNCVGFLSISLLGTPWLIANTTVLQKSDHYDHFSACAAHYGVFICLWWLTSTTLLLAVWDPVKPISLKFARCCHCKFRHTEKSNDRALQGCWCYPHQSVSHDISEGYILWIISVWRIRFEIPNPLQQSQFHELLNVLNSKLWSIRHS